MSIGIGTQVRQNDVDGRMEHRKMVLGIVVRNTMLAGALLPLPSVEIGEGIALTVLLLVGEWVRSLLGKHFVSNVIADIVSRAILRIPGLHEALRHAEGVTQGLTLPLEVHRRTGPSARCCKVAPLV